MDKAMQTMIDNLHKNTGKSLEEWTTLINSKNFGKHGEMVKYLKEEYSLGHGFANLIAHKAKASDADSASDTNDLIAKQYIGKEHFKPIYDKIIHEITQWDGEFEVAPKNAYVSLRRKKQFAILQPATKTRFEIGINLKGQEARGVLEAINSANAMCSHKINIFSVDDLNQEVFDWIKKAFDAAE
jgi:predicted transport protein